MAHPTGNVMHGRTFRRRTSTKWLLAAVFVLAAAVCIPIAASTASGPNGSDTVDEIHASFGDNAETSMWVGWHGAAASFSYGLDSSYGQSATPITNSVVPVDISGPFQHVMLTGLAAGSVYHYQIDSGADHQFKTAPSGDFTWDDIGDTGSTFNSFNASTGTGCDASWMSTVWQQVAAELPDFVSHGGDITYANECGTGAVHQYFNDIEPISTLRAYEQSWGNHEYEAATSDAPPGTPRDSMANYKGRLYLANAQASSNDTTSQVANPGCPSPANPAVNGCLGDDWGYYTVGHVLIIEYPEPWYLSQQHWGPQAAALMAAAEADPNISFIVTTGHRPAYSASTSQLDAPLKTVLDGLGDKYSPAARPDGKYVLNIAHHVHGGEVFSPQHGVVQITNGGGGNEESSFGKPVAGSLYHIGHFEHLHITVTGPTMKVDMICGPVWPGHQTSDVCTMGSTVYSTTITSPVAPPTPTATPTPTPTVTDTSTAAGTPTPTPTGTTTPPPAPKQWVLNQGFDNGSITGWNNLFSSVSKLSTAKDATGNWRLVVGTTSSTSQGAGACNHTPYWINNATVAGTTYTATVQAQPSVAGEQVYFYLRETNPAGTQVGFAQTPTLTMNNTTAMTQLANVTYTAKATGNSIRSCLAVTNLSGSHQLFGDNFSITSPG